MISRIRFRNRRQKLVKKLVNQKRSRVNSISRNVNLFGQMYCYNVRYSYHGKLGKE